ncbi:hypothetical protein BCR33DRAFT_717382 [Rhizoclosmatium globosum]|uniref:NodB homology domain-containing protein n=1 Tax=Rhizoclosmatium globosum TaxID=329046 RepID=A0A1Y2CA37_9FUNG|nr:hypothetical protein BCR33DRAFT_717382 [Rhizoclosmatium globosum]|eukprot:ORY43724.1 hypothetical protein BCR33DRAFT_717382 [Rhizoclosmatium globosum]
MHNTFAFLLALATTAISFPLGCFNSSHATLVLTSDLLTADTLAALTDKNIRATFFVTPEWALKHKKTVTDALFKHHSIGLAIPSLDGLVAPTPTCAYGICDYTVQPDALTAYFDKEEKQWLNMGYVTPSLRTLKLIAFTNTALADLRYGSLEDAVAKLGYTPILADFWKDTWNVDTATTQDVTLANFFGAADLCDLSDYLAERKTTTNLMDINVIAEAVDFLATQNITVVSMRDCVGKTLY